MEIISREAARAAGLKFYFNGKPCRSGGHLAPRYVSCKMCLECRDIYAAAYRAKDPDRVREIEKKSRKKNAESVSAAKRDWYERNIEKQNEANRRYAQRNKAAMNERAKMRQVVKLQRMPPWVDRDEIKRIYENRPDGYHVDHIIPLKGNNVSGLHVPWNLQYLPASENMSKGNRLVDIG
jgi:hypothetical protein